MQSIAEWQDNSRREHTPPPPRHHTRPSRRRLRRRAQQQRSWSWQDGYLADLARNPANNRHHGHASQARRHHPT
jgi:hypothetical protein